VGLTLSSTFLLFSEWNPKTDKHLFANYDITDFEEGKRQNKMKLQEELGLPVNADIPMVAFIGRLDPQKGADILLQVRST
jgi:glycogen synthase